MRTTIDIDEDVLLAAKEMAHRSKVSLGRAISTLLREALSRPSAGDTRNGFPLLARRPGVVVTAELVNRLRDDGAL